MIEFTNKIVCKLISCFFFSFVEWTDEVLSSKEDSVVNHFRLLGVMEALAAIFKVSFFFVTCSCSLCFQ